MDPGICYIKPEYLVPEVRVAEVDAATNKRKSVDSQAQNDESGGNSKYQKTGHKGRKRGQNKKRPVYKDDRASQLCNSLINGDTTNKCSDQNCIFVHNLEVFMSEKAEDIGDECPIFKAKGYCMRGVTCRFAKSHLDADGHNIKATHYDETKGPTTFNGIKPELQNLLRKREYDFKKCKNLLAQFEEIRDQKLKITRQIEGDGKVPVAVPLGLGSYFNLGNRDGDRNPPIDFSNKLILSPLTTVGNLPFRRICKEFGADITCGEMACAIPLLKGLKQEWALTKRHESEDIFGVQLCGNNPTSIAQAAQLLQETTKVDYIDLNIGCPIDLIYQQGGGSALMRRTNILELTVRTCSALSQKIPFTVKMRTGVYKDKNLAHDLIPRVEEWGATAVTLHGRSREQRYLKSANWQYIEECASKVKRIPVIGNGDIYNFEDYNACLQTAPHVSSVMIGRGALIKPWIFKEIKEQKHWMPTSTERFEILKKYVNYGLEHWGSDTRGVETTRRFLLEWISFLYRYVPYELLANPPQKINQRPQYFRGRDEMETLLLSSNSQDWMKISEMLLGKGPAGFTFVPKHKANSY
ncbi:tRNA-dihydrouridine(47) synthase [NAD(P)(+)]-like [Teleopsis dalmanni]|uniref:tRNA-dihydrouridine(47) synthase [NAD(P)(+)]-like n=1 Tax=Teleopsis dalmanni TaxID=139649 RepID=UPI000D32BC64|nr:tRNA-dihydrouridine(47) synthase [NAD(P)(+)]-like [Teleopsis dalmanni]